ncbi:MAG: prepilin-type N-terminal cleavage/methylation domain-containing protein [bacterium]|nr:prepilin-type N-terminal cleavage/methylation domain-containing protein [bacterium]
MRTLPSPRQATTERNRSGFTILEVMLAMGILVIGMTILLSLLTFGAALTRTAALRTTSSTVIESVVADLEESLFPLAEDGTVGEPRTITDRAVPSAPGVVYSAVATAHVEGPYLGEMPLEYKVDIEVKWGSRGVKRARSYETILLREVPFGERMRRMFIEHGSNTGIDK